MLRELTQKRTANDHRLKVLWIEDKLPASLSSTLSRYFTVWRAWRPDEISQRLREELVAIYLQRGEARAYNMGCLPFDGFLADFNLMGAGLDAESRVDSEEDNDSIPYPNEEVESGLSDLAQGAEAAGLTAAILTALNFDSHPAVVVPYTAYQEQLSRQRALILLLAPASLVISKGSELDRGKESDLGPKLQQFADDYRNQLPRWASHDVVSIPSGERQRVEVLAKERAYGNEEAEKVKWDDLDYIVVDTLYGRRRISCGSLWYRFDGSDPSLAEVNKWLEQMPIPTAVYSAAVRLAEDYWRYSETDASRYRYMLSRLIRSVKAAKPGSYEATTRSNIKLLCNAFGVDFDAAMDSPSSVTVAERKCIPQLLISDETKEVKRLAVFILLIMEYAGRWASTQNEADLLWKLSRVVDFKDEGMEDRPIRRFDEIDLDNKDGLDMETLRTVVTDLGYDGLVIDKGELLLHRVQVRDSDMAQRLDPLPEQLLTTEEKFSGERVYQQLKRIGIDLAALIANTEGGGIEPDERREVQYFALDIGFPPSNWPEWLRRNYL